MNKAKRVLSLMTRMVLWSLLSALIWNFIVNLLTDVPPRDKVTIYISSVDTALRDRELSYALEQGMPSSVRMVRCHPFSYLMIGEDISRGDLLILPESEAAAYLDRFSPLPEELRSHGPLFTADGETYGVRVWDSESMSGCAASYIDYSSSQGDWYLFCGRDSLHIPSKDGGADRAACGVAEELFSLE
ncbi:MAG: hypothetical protein IKI84_03545 [Clostridia bacterium]|nr:hypothetical protein [Clostridia bacterium]